MSMRISSATLLLLVAGCSGRADQTADTDVLAKAEADQSDAAAEDGRILCAHGTAPMTRSCTVERTQGEGGLVLTVRHADGGFRRLLVTTDGRGVIAADGAAKAKVAIVGASDIEVTLGGDRYRLPATVKGAPRAS